MACKNRDEVIHLLAEFDLKLYTECQRGAFHTQCTQIEREAIKHLKSAILFANGVILSSDL